MKGDRVTEAMLPEFEQRLNAREVRAWAALSDRDAGMDQATIALLYGFSAAELDECESSWRAVQRGEHPISGK